MILILSLQTGLDRHRPSETLPIVTLITTTIVHQLLHRQMDNLF